MASVLVLTHVGVFLLGWFAGGWFMRWLQRQTAGTEEPWEPCREVYQYGRAVKVCLLQKGHATPHAGHTVHVQEG